MRLKAFVARMIYDLAAGIANARKRTMAKPAKP
jgi:hypothetical protein